MVVANAQTPLIFCIEVDVMARTGYYTVDGTAYAEYEEKKSRFLAYVGHAEDEKSAHEFIEKIKSKHWDAAHNVYAYIAGADIKCQKFSDDGEPSGTAGLPVLEAIKRKKLEDVIVVVSRYFGGVLLGASGLVRAYGKAASLGIEAARIVAVKMCYPIDIDIEYGLLGKMQNLFKQYEVSVVDAIYSDKVNIKILVPYDKAEPLLKEISQVSSGTAQVVQGLCQYSKIESDPQCVKW